jgi:translation initiation factor IF-1
MAKEELIEMHGSVTEVLPDGRYRVTLENGHNLIAYAGGKLKKNHIRIIAGDEVTLEMSPTISPRAASPSVTCRPNRPTCRRRPPAATERAAPAGEARRTASIPIRHEALAIGKGLCFDASPCPPRHASYCFC